MHLCICVRVEKGVLGYGGSCWERRWLGMGMEDAEVYISQE